MPRKGTHEPSGRRDNFDHEKLLAYQRAIQFVAWSSQLLENLPPKLAVSDQLDRASTSIPLNLAEGNGNYTGPDRCRYFDTARGSALECAACLEIRAGKELLHETVCLVVGLIKSIAPERLGEEALDYRDKNRARTETKDKEQEQEEGESA